MRFAFDVGSREKSHIEFHRDPICGRMTVTANGRVTELRSPLRLCTHFNLRPVQRYEIAVGESEPHVIAIEHERPRWLAGLPWMSGLCRNTYRVFVDGQLTEEHHGF